MARNIQCIGASYTVFALQQSLHTLDLASLHSTLPTFPLDPSCFGAMFDTDHAIQHSMLYHHELLWHGCPTSEILQNSPQSQTYQFVGKDIILDHEVLRHITEQCSSNDHGYKSLESAVFTVLQHHSLIEPNNEDWLQMSALLASLTSVIPGVQLRPASPQALWWWPGLSFEAPKGEL
jgi:hypothetical protein